VTLKIEKTFGQDRTTIRLIGRVQAESLVEVRMQLEGCGPTLALELDQVTLVDVDVVRFLNTCESQGVLLLDCSPYIREWMNRERSRTGRK
jgi:hypothetical protein